MEGLGAATVPTTLRPPTLLGSHNKVLRLTDGTVRFLWVTISGNTEKNRVEATAVALGGGTSWAQHGSHHAFLCHVLQGLGRHLHGYGRLAVVQPRCVLGLLCPYWAALVHLFVYNQSWLWERRGQGSQGSSRPHVRVTGSPSLPGSPCARMSSSKRCCHWPLSLGSHHPIVPMAAWEPRTARAPPPAPSHRGPCHSQVEPFMGACRGHLEKNITSNYDKDFGTGALCAHRRSFKSMKEFYKGGEDSMELPASQQAWTSLEVPHMQMKRAMRYHLSLSGAKIEKNFGSPQVA